ncbi:unnamed protein product, partial [Meganyctiphanes norvegica]
GANKNQTHDGVDLLKKFEADVVTAEKLTGGDMNIIENMRSGSGRKKLSGNRFKEGEIVWARHQHKWWPAYIKAFYQRENKVSVRFINCQQDGGIQIKCEKIKSFHCNEFTSFINQNYQGFTRAVNMASRFSEMRRKDNSITAEEFFTKMSLK